MVAQHFITTQVRNSFSTLFALLIVSVTLFGCASVPMADKEHDRQAKSFTPKTGMSNIYIYRELRLFVGAAMSWSVSIDGQAAGTIGSGNFIQIEVSPGDHTISSFFNLDHREAIVEIDTKAGKNYFLEEGETVATTNNLHQVDEAIGVSEVSKCKMISIPENLIRSIETAKKLKQDAAIQRNFARPDKITAPSPIAGNSGKYRSPFTAAGTVALWAQKPVAATDNGSDLAASVGGAVGQKVADKALEFVPFGLGGMIGRSAGESAARAATKKAIEPELPGMDAVSASSDISFNSADDLAVYMYAKHSAHGQYARVLALAQRVYPELQDAYTSAIEKASQASDSKQGQSADERLDALKKLKDKGSISEAEFQTKRSEILKSL